MQNSTAKILGLSFIIGMIVVGMLFVKSRQQQKSLRVVGYSSKQFVSDLVKWNLTVQKTTDVNTLNSAYRTLSTDINAFKTHLINNGVSEDKISIQPVTSNPIYDNFSRITSYNLTQNVFIISDDLDKIEALALNPEFFAEKELLLQMSFLSYLYTKLPELKKELLAAATKDALERAEEISSAARGKLGKMREARAGVFQITEPYSTEVSDYGIYNTTTRNKSIAVTLTATFDLK